MLARLWQLPSGAITTVMIALFFRPEQQGVYYLILTLTGLQALADAGLINTLLHAASHETAGARLDRRGFFRTRRRSRARLAAITRFAVVWFVSAATLLIVAGTLVGVMLLRRQPDGMTAFPALAAAMIAAGSAFALSPLVGILEGCNQVRVVNRYRLLQAVLGSLVVWGCLISGAGLWTAAAAIATQLVCELLLLAGVYRRFFVQLWRTVPGRFDWRRELWPLQWRIAVQSIARYAAFLPILPVLFDTQGPEVAGRYGMTWQVVNNLIMIAYVYIRTRSPDFGRLIAERRRGDSVAAFQAATVGSTLLLIGLMALFCSGLWGLGQLPWTPARQVAARFLNLEICLWFAVASVPLHLVQCFAMYIRSQKFDPIWRASLPASAALTGLAYWSASRGQIEWIAWSMMLVFTAEVIALGWMCRWYHRHFQALESS